MSQMWVMDYRKDPQLHGFESKQKISLPMASKAEDTLKTLRLSRDTSGNSPSESPLYDSGSEDSVVSGPSSPSAAIHSLRCRTCERLFTKSRRQRRPSKKQRDDDPASLSCDEWLLNKTWHPQRRQRSRGRLWVHLKRIRLRAARQADGGTANKSWALCSRPHVFLQRNLRRCKKMSGKQKRKANPIHQRRNRARFQQPLQSEKYQRRKKRKSSEKDDTSEHFLPLDITVTLKDKPPADDNTHREDLQRWDKVPKTQSVSDVSGFLDIQSNNSGLEGTRRVLKFDSSPGAVLTDTWKPMHRLVHRSTGAKLYKDQADFDEKNGDCPSNPDDDLCEVSDVFRTPIDPYSVNLEITRKSGPSRVFGTRKASFRTMLAALGQRQNQIIKESHH